QHAWNHEAFQDVPGRISRLAVIERLFARRALAIADFAVRFHLDEYDSSPIGPAKTGFEKTDQRQVTLPHPDRLDSYHCFPFCGVPHPPPPGSPGGHRLAKPSLDLQAILCVVRSAFIAETSRGKETQL